MERIKVLAVEDEEVTQQLIRIGLKDQRFDLRVVANGEEALVEYKAWKPDIILLDIIMPVMNGFEVLEHIRTTLEDRETTVIMLSSVSSKGDILECIKLGIQGYILKPFAAKQLAETVLKYHGAKSRAAKG